MQKIIAASLLAGLLSFIPQAEAAKSPVAISVVPPVQFPPDDFTVTGLRTSLLWGRHRNVYGIDLGLLASHTQQEFVGLAISGGANWTGGRATILGLQLAGLANVNKQQTNVYGVQAALGVNYNEAASSVSGLQLALANLSGHTTIYGAQVGIYNKALTVYGFQIGLVNVTDSLHGVQIGLINFHRKGHFVVSPILNIGF